MRPSDAIKENLDLITGGDPALDIELLEVFLLTSNQYIDGMRAADAKDDSVAWRSEAHAMKGGCFNIGADRLGEICQAAHGEAELGAGRAEILRKMEEEFANLRVTILDMIKERKERQEKT